MPLQSLLYVSEYVDDGEDALDRVAAIVSYANHNNREFSVAGALIFTGKHFAQVLEGSSAQLVKLMTSIELDARHTNLVIYDRTAISVRRFPTWSLAYAGPSHFVSRHINELLGNSELERSRQTKTWLAEMMLEFSNCDTQATANPRATMFSQSRSGS